jgi:hypothetical protein
MPDRPIGSTRLLQQNLPIPEVAFTIGLLSSASGLVKFSTRFIKETFSGIDAYCSCCGAVVWRRRILGSPSMANEADACPRPGRARLPDLWILTNSALPASEQVYVACGPKGGTGSRTMQKLAEYPESARQFERLATEEAHPEIKAQFEAQAASYQKLAERRERVLRAVGKISN